MNNVIIVYEKCTILNNVSCHNMQKYEILEYMDKIRACMAIQ